jgi:signal transduction histidine kinase
MGLARKRPNVLILGDGARFVEPAAPRLRFELVAFLLIVATFGAVLFKDLIVDRHFTINRATIPRYTRYWFSDGDGPGSGTSFAVGDPHDPLRWQCRLTAKFANPYCGFGMTLDPGNRGVGRDLRRYETIALEFDYHGPAKTLKIVAKNYDSRFSSPGRGDSTKPNVIDFPVREGPNRIKLNLGDAAVEQWWIALHPGLIDAGKPALDNVVAIDLQTGTGAPPGRYQIALREISVGGQTITPEHWYLILLGSWTGFAALYLVYRVAHLRRDHADRQRALLAERRFLLETQEATQNASRAKSRFLAHISHELRAPLNAILGYAQILRAGELSNQQNIAARTIQQSGEHLLTLIEDILDLSRIEADKLELAPRPVAIRGLVRAVADMVAVRAKEKDLAFEWQVAADVPLSVFVDDKCLRQVLLNLLGNAIKFTTRGEVRLDVALLALGEHEAVVRIEVRDTGMGIRPEDLDRIFEPFEQAQEAVNSPGGTGLGLSISRRIVELMRGRLSVESEFGTGSCFSIELPLATSDPEAVASPDLRGVSHAVMRVTRLLH